MAPGGRPPSAGASRPSCGSTSWMPASRTNTCSGIPPSARARALVVRVAFAQPMHAYSPKLKSGERHRPFAWVWIEYFDKRNDQKTPRLTRAELNGIIAGMKYCFEYSSGVDDPQ